MTEQQTKLLAAFEQACEKANRDREVALAVVLAGHGITDAHVVGYDFDAGTIRIATKEEA